MSSRTRYRNDRWATGSWATDGRTDEDEPTYQSESWGPWADAVSEAAAWETDGQAAWETDRWDNRHRTESTETTDPGGSQSTWSSDIASTDWPSAGWSSSEPAWTAWKSSGWVDRSEQKWRMEVQELEMQE